MSRRNLHRVAFTALAAFACCGSVCYGQNDNGRFTASSYVTILGRSTANIDSGGWNFWVTNLNAGYSRESLVSQFLATSEYQNLQSSFVANRNAYDCSWNGVPFPSPGDPAYVNELFVYMLYHYAMGRCPDAGGYSFYVSSLNGGVHTAKSFPGLFTPASSSRGTGRRWIHF